MVEREAIIRIRVRVPEQFHDRYGLKMNEYVQFIQNYLVDFGAVILEVKQMDDLRLPKPLIRKPSI